MVLVNGTAGAQIDPLDRGLAYGDGVFRTLLVRQGAPLHWEWHYAKLLLDCAALDLHCPNKALLAEEIARAATEDCVLKIIVTAGPSKRGYARDPAASPTRVISSSPIPLYPAHFKERGIRMHHCQLRLGRQPRLAGVKHLNRLENVLARSEWNDPEVPEGLLLDEAGNLVSGTMSNLFFCKNGVLHTPDLSHAGVAGVSRSRILDAAQNSGIPVRVDNFQLDALLAADEAFVVNSVIGLWPVREIAERTFNENAMTGKISALL